jgi:hypothetical protein
MDDEIDEGFEEMVDPIECSWLNLLLKYRYSNTLHKILSIDMDNNDILAVLRVLNFNIDLKKD